MKPEGRCSFIIIYFSRNVLDKNVLLFISLLKIPGKNADFLYDTIETYIKDAEKANKSDYGEQED